MTRQRLDRVPSTVSSNGNQGTEGLPLFTGVPLAPVTRPGEGQLDCGPVLKRVLTEAMKPFSRYDVAAGIGKFTGRDITKTILDAWTAESKDQNQMPAHLVPAFVHATQDTGLIEELCRLSGGAFVPFEETRLLRKARIQKTIELLKQQMHSLK